MYENYFYSENEFEPTSLIQTYDLSKGLVINELKIHIPREGDDVNFGNGSIYPIGFSPTFNAIVLRDIGGNRGYGCALFNLLSNKLTDIIGNCGEPVFSSDGKKVAVGNNFGQLAVYDTSTGKEIKKIETGSGKVGAVAFHPNDIFLTSVNSDNSIRMYGSTGQHLATLVLKDENEWVVVSPEGYFDGTPSGWNKVGWRFSNDPIDIQPTEIFFNEFYHPGLLKEVIEGKPPVAPRNIAQLDRCRPNLNLTRADGQSSDTPITTPNVTVTIEVKETLIGKSYFTQRHTLQRLRSRPGQQSTPQPSAPTGSGAQDIRLFRNGSLVKVWHGDVLKGQSGVMLEATIPIVAGENRLTAYAFNHDNVKSSDATLIINGADNLKRQGTAYVLAVGVNSYSNPQYNLKYAVADAEVFSAEIKRQQETLKNYAQVEVIPLYDKNATKANILQTLSQLATKAQPEDAVIVFFSGHGTAQQQRFYLIPHDLGYQGRARNFPHQT